MDKRAYSVVVIGGGPAGMWAAIEANQAGARTALIEERHALGGQAYKQLPAAYKVHNSKALDRQFRAGRDLSMRLRESSVDIFLDTVAWGLGANHVALQATEGSAAELVADQVVIATGAYDRPVIFPGWTLPGVLTAGGAHSLIRAQRVSPGKRIVMVGTGPLLLAFSAQLHSYGAPITQVVDSNPFPDVRSMVRLTGAARRDKRLLIDGASYLGYLLRHRVPRLYSHAIVRVDGNDRVESVTVARLAGDGKIEAGTETTIDADTVCVGYGFAPSSELTRVAGCSQTWDDSLGCLIPSHDDFMRTSRDGVLVAGDCTQIGGSEIAAAQGRLAGLTAANQAGALADPAYVAQAAHLRRELSYHAAFRAALDALYPLPDWIYDLAAPSTVVCRCEDVTLDDLVRAIPDWTCDANDLKSWSRAGMGYCQGRNCGAFVRHLAKEGRALSGESGWFTPRPPVKPVLIAEIAQEIKDRGYDKPIS